MTLTRMTFELASNGAICLYPMNMCGLKPKRGHTNENEAEKIESKNV